MKIRTFQLLYPKKVDDRREITEKMIDEIVTNSGEGTRFPVSLGHFDAVGFFDDSKPAAGKILNLRKDENGSLLSDVQLRNHVDAEYEDGAYPGWSVGIFKTKAQGWQMDHLALLGSVGAAFKDLQEIDTKAFSVVDQSEHSMTVNCFSAEGDSEKTLWLVQSTPKEPTAIETPCAFSSVSDNGGKKEMDSKEFAAQMAKSAETIEELQAANAQLKADTQVQAKIETDRRVAEFAGIKIDLLAAAAAKGVAKPAREMLSAALDGYDTHYAGGVVSKELFAAVTQVLSELKPKVEPGEAHDENEADEFVLQTKFTSDQAINALIS